LRHEKTALLLALARELASSAEGLTLSEMAERVGVGRRTVERMRDALFLLFPQTEEIDDPPTKRFRISGGLDAFFQTPTTDELVELSRVAAGLKRSGAIARADALGSLEMKIRSAMRASALRRMAPDVEVLSRSEITATGPGPRPYENPELLAGIRQAIMAMRALRFVYSGGSSSGQARDVVPYGLVFGHVNYLIAAQLPGDQIKTYRLDRIKDIEILDRDVTSPPDFDIKDFTARSFGYFQSDVHQIALRLLPTGSKDIRRWLFHPSQTLEECADGTVIIRFSASGLLELSWHLFT